MILAAALQFGCHDASNPGKESGHDSVDDTDHETAEANLGDLSWRLHDEVASMVYVTWTQAEPGNVHVEYSFDDGVWDNTPTFDATAGPQEQLVVGIPFQTEAVWRVVAESGDSADGPTITTGPYPTDLPQGEVSVSDPALWVENSRYLLTSINQDGGWTAGTFWTFIIDREARVVWAKKTPDRHWSIYATVGNTRDYLLIDENTAWSDFNATTSFLHKRYLDEEIEEIPTPGLHHAFIQMSDGTLAWGSLAHGGGEALVEMAPGDTEQTILWTCQDNWPGSLPCGSNGLFYDEASNTFLYSFYSNNSIVEVDRATGDDVWWAGGMPGGYSFDPPESQYSWQHGVTWTNAGTLLVSSTTGARDTVLLEYDVDRTNGVLHNVWENSSNVFADTNRDAWRYDNGNTLHMVGAAGVCREVDPAGNDIWRVDWHGEYLLGRGQFIQDLYSLIKPRE